MKAKREHRVPLTLPMVEIINRQHRTDPSGIAFKAARGGMLSDMTLSALMKRMHEKHLSAGSGFIDTKSKRPAVPHGLRSTFRDWVAESEQSREAAELQLAHQFGSAVEHAYYRSDLLDQRARLLDDWYNFLEQN
jgi:integrase